MSKEKKQEKDLIIQKIKEIDEILGTETNIRKLITLGDLGHALGGASLGSFAILGIYTLNPNFTVEHKTIFMSTLMILGTLSGFTLSHAESFKDKYGFKDMYKHYEYAYTRLSRKDQIKILNISKELFKLLSNDLNYKNNINLAKEYLNINVFQRTFFENLDYEHPYHQLLTSEQEKEIHNQGLLTPEEAVRYWESGFSDVCIPSDKNRCERFNDCHDCLVHYSETKPNGWEPIHFYQKTLGPKPNKEQ